MLYAWLGRNKFSTPTYDTKQEVRNGKTRFKCELRVPGFSYCAFGNSTNKKDAATNAALDFCQYLVRQGKMQQNEMPVVDSSTFDGANSSWQGGQQDNGEQTIFGNEGGGGDNTQQASTVRTDFVLIVLREMISEYHDLRVVLMSATIDTELFTNFFGSNSTIGPTPVIKMDGRAFPVQSFFLEDILQNLKYMPEEPDKKKKKGAPQEDDEGEEEVDDKGKNMNIIDDPNANQSLRIALSRLSEKEIPYGVIEAILSDIACRGVDGAVLIFLPGWSDIMSLFNRLNDHPEFSQSQKYEILPLHSQLTSVEQRKVFNHYEGKRKIIISTNIAETSITIDDVVYVIDSCKAKERMYTSNNNMVHFATVWASRTNIVQRRGRAGRVRPGYAFELCSKKRFEALDEHGTAEILRIPLHQIALTIKLLRLGSVGDFLGKALEPPPYDMVVESEAVLQSMGALDRNLELTSLGRMLARMPIEPVIAKVLILGTALGNSAPSVFDEKSGFPSRNRAVSTLQPMCEDQEIAAFVGERRGSSTSSIILMDGFELATSPSRRASSASTYSTNEKKQRKNSREIEKFIDEVQ
ncbi:unnamed protein product [Caenorhabditis angaria]|uniref:RNA helicase n=1 Tax=Caenorhabditis angaria TaxID=860376 RepID=A0A9P1IA22_9PELO|nr:unnamed protein product [Caenorhabditis angaria]